jgi:UDP-N-acetylmuramoylalanine--D-glutamate ligase
MRPIEGAKILVAGLARSGLAAIEFLRARGAELRAADRTPLHLLPEAAQALLARNNVPFVPQTADAFDWPEWIVASPGVPWSVFGAAWTKVVGEVELASWFLEGPILAITGSNGKTTTASLTAHLLAAAGIAHQLGGNIGLPPTAMIPTSRPGQWNVLELSSFQLASTSTFHARIAAVLNLTENHLDWHGGWDHYVNSKRRILRNQTPADHAILRLNDPVTTEFADWTPAQVHWFDASQVASLLPLTDVLLAGRHNLENIAAAAQMASLAGASREAIAQGIRTFRGVEHRLEFVRERRGVRYYNDSKATTPEATLTAIRAIPGPLWIILGGKNKGLDFTPLAPVLRERARAALLVGQDAPEIRAALAGAVPLIDSLTVDAAARHASAHAQPGDAVLLAPGCTSWDQFNNYEERGNLFKRAVLEIGD